MSETTNYFKQLNAVKCVTETKNKLTYVSWSDAWAEVKKLYPESTYTIYENTDWTAFWETKFGIDVKVWVTINWIEHIVRLPVMDWANKYMYFESYTYKTKYETKTVPWATAFDINKTIQRAFTKAIWMHWLWLYVYRWEDLPESIEDDTWKTKEAPKTESGKKVLTKTVLDNMKKALEAKTHTVEQVKTKLEEYEVKDMVKTLAYLNIK